jgi:hypothetical protein
MGVLMHSPTGRGYARYLDDMQESFSVSERRKAGTTNQEGNLNGILYKVWNAVRNGSSLLR